VTAAADAHHAARRINRDPGVVRRVVWLYEQMAPADADQTLDAVRVAAGGAGVV
jgi:hypothetical protein